MNVARISHITFFKFLSSLKCFKQKLAKKKESILYTLHFVNVIDFELNKEIAPMSYFQNRFTEFDITYYCSPCPDLSKVLSVCLSVYDFFSASTD